MLRGSALLLGVLLLAGQAPARAEASRSDPEAAQAAQEQAFEDAKGAENFQLLFNGKLMIGGVSDAPEGVVGAFVYEKHAYMLKLSKPELLQKLMPHNGKEVTLKGRPRNNNKYFFAEDLAETVANPVVPHKRERGGL